jgi:hypothetical protein
MKISKKYDLSELAQRIERVRDSQPGEPARFKGFEIDDAESVLETCIDFQPQIPEADRRGLIREAIASATQAGTVDAAALEKHLRGAERKYLQTPLVEYVIASSVTVRHFKGMRRVALSGVTLTFSNALPRQFERGTIQEKIDDVTKIADPHRLTVVRIRVRARTHAAAMREALDQLDLLRGIWNYWVNSRTQMRFTWGPQRPVNEILLGPVHTIHHPSGALAADVFWYEEGHRQSDRLYNLAPHWVQVRNWERRLRRRLREIDYGDDLGALFVRYARALDITDSDVAFNKLWGVLEHLAGAVGNYSNLIDRVVFLYVEGDRGFARLLLEHLRDVRNELVHMDEARESMQTYLYQLKRFVEALVRFHLSRGREFSSLNTAAQFLDLPPDPKVLKQRVELLQKALKYQARE